ncbi:MAG: class I SAM-dependent methyltransferase [Anaerolineales bacterium]
MTTSLIGTLLLIAAAAYWELHLAEGAHLGSGVVVWLYDLTAHRYEAIKEFDAAFDDEFLGFPLAAALADRRQPRLLDVAAGTGRLARSLHRQVAFDGHIVATDLSARMLQHARREVDAQREVRFVRHAAGRLPFATETFDAVTCLEALEFLPDARRVVAECVRVLRPNGILVLTNRVGGSARWLVGKTFTRSEFRALLKSHALHNIAVQTWQVDYDLAWARK